MTYPELICLQALILLVNINKRAKCILVDTQHKHAQLVLMLMSITYFMQIIRVLLKLVQTHRHVGSMVDDLYVIEVLFAELGM